MGVLLKKNGLSIYVNDAGDVEWLYVVVVLVSKVMVGVVGGISLQVEMCIVLIIKWNGSIRGRWCGMTEITVKVNTRELTRQLNDLDLLQYQFKPNELKEFIKENLEVVEIGSSEDIRFYISLKKRGD